MEVGDIRFYTDRWKAVEEFERQELQAMSLEEHWRKLNAIARFAIEMDIEKEGSVQTGGLIYLSHRER